MIISSGRLFPIEKEECDWIMLWEQYFGCLLISARGTFSKHSMLFLVCRYIGWFTCVEAQKMLPWLVLMTLPSSRPWVIDQYSYKPAIGGQVKKAINARTRHCKKPHASFVPISTQAALLQSLIMSATLSWVHLPAPLPM